MGLDNKDFVKECLKTGVPRAKELGKIVCVFGAKSAQGIENNQDLLDQLSSLNFDYRFFENDAYIGVFEEDKKSDVNKVAVGYRNSLMKCTADGLQTASMVAETDNLENIIQVMADLLRQSEKQGTHFHKY